MRRGADRTAEGHLQLSGSATDCRDLAGASPSSRHGCQGRRRRPRVRDAPPGQMTWAKVCGFGFGLAGRRRPQRAHQEERNGRLWALKLVLLVALGLAVEPVASGSALALRSARQAATRALIA